MSDKKLIVTEELLEEFRKVPATVDGIRNFIRTHDYRQFSAFQENMTSEQKEAAREAVKIIAKNALRY